MSGPHPTTRLSPGLPRLGHRRRLSHLEPDGPWAEGLPLNFKHSAVPKMSCGVSQRPRNHPVSPQLWFLTLAAVGGLAIAGQQIEPVTGRPLWPLSHSPSRPTPGVVDPQRDDLAHVISVVRIWDRAPHNAFTDLIRFEGRWYCAFREGMAHASPDGAIRVITSADGNDWMTAAELRIPGGDLRDPKLSITPDRRLMLSAVVAYPPGGPTRHQTLAWFSVDGRNWYEPFRIGDRNFWLWRVIWHRGNAYSVAYSTTEERFLRFYTGPGGMRFQAIGDRICEDPAASEATLLFDDSDDSALCLVRRDGERATALLGTSRQPYRAWRWSELNVRIASPHMIRVPGGRILVAGRLYEPEVHTGLCWLDPRTLTLTEFLPLPSGGDTGYPGLVHWAGSLWVSYYSSHEGRAAIYFAQVKLPTVGARAR